MIDDKDEMLISLLERLADEKELIETIEQYTNEFKDIYVGGYRHKYSDIHSVLLNLSQEDRDYLSESLKAIYDNILDDFQEKEKILKLYDHIQLENMRNSEMREYAEKVKAFDDKYLNHRKSLKETEGKLSKAKRELENTKRYIEGLEEKLRSSETHSITILGIFTGVVMTFTGGLSFTTSTLQNMNIASKYRLIFTILLLGATVFNIIYMLIYSIGKINGTYIGSECNCDNKIKGCKDKTMKCSVVRYPVAMWINFTILVGMISTLLLYLIDRYNLITLILSKNNWFALVIAIVIIVLIGAVAYRIIKWVNSICKYEYRESIFSKIKKSFFDGYVVRDNRQNTDI